MATLNQLLKNQTIVRRLKDFHFQMFLETTKNYHWKKYKHYDSLIGKYCLQILDKI